MINNSYLLGLYGGTAGNTATTGGQAAAPRVRTQPTPPWEASAKAPKPDVAVRAALSARQLVNPDASRPDLPGASPDYRKLFALYQGLTSLTALATRVDQSGVSQGEITRIRERFTRGVAEVGDYVRNGGFEDIRMVHGVSSTSAKTSAGVARDTTRIVTRPVHEGDPASSAPALEGPVVFDITIGSLAGNVTVPIDLAGMGAQTRSLDNVITFVNAKLSDAGVATRLGREQVNGAPRTIQLGTRTITLPTATDKWALVLQGSSAETVRFGTTQTSDAVYVVQASGKGGGNELLKFQSDGGTAPEPLQPSGQTGWVAGRASQTALPKGVETVRASAVAADGSLWLVADIEAAPGSQPLKGERDVALMKLDPTGRVVATRMLGASDTASGYAISIAADGRVAVAGSVTGELEPGVRIADASLSDSFVTVFDGTGEELWTQRRGARAADEATAVSFGTDGRVYVAGRSRSAMPGASGLGAWDGYLQGFSATQAHSLAPFKAAAVSVSQFGTGGDDSVRAITVEGSSIYTAGVESGRVVVRRFTPDANGAPTLSATRDLGAASGDVSGIAVSGGRVVLTGTTRNQALDVATVTNAHSGSSDAFVASLEADLSPAAGDRLTYIGGAGDSSVADMKVHGGKVWITGLADRAVGAANDDPREGYLTRLDPLTGAVEWTRTWPGADQQASPLSLAVATGGASVLDRLGLPQGLVSMGDSKALTAATALRPGDRFYVSSAEGSQRRAVTIAADDTLQTLARKIEQSSSGQLKVTVVTDPLKAGEVEALSSARMQRLSIAPREGRAGAILTAGEAGRDALAALGLSPGIVGPKAAAGEIKTFAMALPETLSLTGKDQIKSTVEALRAAVRVVREAYKSLAPGASRPPVTGPAPAYMTAQLANYQAALSRLTG